MIDSNIILKKADSPFLVQTDLVISPNGKITVEPGVVLQFADDVALEVRGTLMANGTKTDSITFTSHTGSAKGKWSGITIINPQGGNASFKYANFRYAAIAVAETCCGGGQVSITHASFRGNVTAIGGYSGRATPVDSCYFSGNTSAITAADKAIDHSIFDGNDYGLCETERVNVSNSTFTNHVEVALSGGRGTVNNCVIENNSTGIRSVYEGFTVTNSIVSNNVLGIELTTEGPMAPVMDNTICNNTSYNIKNNGSNDGSLYNNCWCTTDSTTVENKIYDVLDDATKGMISYDILDEKCDEVILHVNKSLPQTVTWSLDHSPYLVTTDYVILPNKTLVIEPGVEVRFGDGINLKVRGTLIANGTKADSITFTSHEGSTKGSWAGIFIQNPQGGNASFNYANFRYAANAVAEECCRGGKVSIKNASFINNIVAIGGYSGSATPVDSCFFSGNTSAITAADKNIDHSFFDGNDYGLHATERVNISNSTFLNHSEIALLGGRGVVNNCVIENNSTGIRSVYEGFTVTNSIVSNNELGIDLATEGKMASVTDNKICNNASYNIKNRSNNGADLYTNCWCTTDSTTVETKIYDGFDDVTKGLVSFDILDGDCDEVVLHVNKSLPETTTWTLERSPYIVTTDYVIFPNKTLVIEPGVEVRFSDGVGLQVRGTLIAIGTKTDSITFTSHTASTKGSWAGILIQNPQGGNAIFNYADFMYAVVAVDEECCSGGKVSIKNTSFISNITAIGGYSGHATPVDSCYFYGNTNAIGAADKDIDHSLFDHNDFGLRETERVNVANSTFTNHLEVALSGGRGTVNNCVIKNNAVGIKSSYEGFMVINSNISNNVLGIQLDISSPSALIKDNQICHNVTFNVTNNSNYPAELYENCWCTADSTTVENKIYDGWDDTSKGLVDYTLYSENCEIPILQTVKALGTVIYFFTGVETRHPDIKLYPNPAAEYLFLENVRNLKEVSIYTTSGQFLLGQFFDNESRGELDLGDLNAGVYLVKINQGGEITTQRLVKTE